MVLFTNVCKYDVILYDFVHYCINLYLLTVLTATHVVEHNLSDLICKI